MVQAIADFFKMVSAELFKEGVGNDGSHNSFGHNASCWYSAGVTSFKS